MYILLHKALFLAKDLLVFDSSYDTAGMWPIIF
jgi:hypothetical protein